jgi:hypothetical protein
MGWPHKPSWEVELVLAVLQALRRNTESVNYNTGEVTHGIDFVREWTIPNRHVNAGFSGRRFDFAVWTQNGDFSKPEFFIEVHGAQHYEFSFLGDEVEESDRLKTLWARGNNIPLLVIPHHEVLSLHAEDKLADRIAQFLAPSRLLRRAPRERRRKRS